MEELKNEYLNKVVVSEQATRKVIIFSTKPYEEVKNLIGDRKINSIKTEQKNNINIYTFNFQNVYPIKKLQEQFDDFIYYKKLKDIIINNNEPRIERYNKEICKEDQIDLNDFKKLSKIEFFKKYPSITLKKDTIEAIIEYIIVSLH